MNNHFSPQAYQYLSLIFLLEALEDSLELTATEEKGIKKQLKKIKSLLTDSEIKLINNRAARLIDDYYNNIQDEVFYQEEHFGSDDNFPWAKISFNQDFYEIWKKGVREKKTVWIKYDSASSGLSERKVDPYKSSSPYGEGYCHNRKEVRKFRFDRVIDIKLLDKKFTK